MEFCYRKAQIHWDKRIHKSLNSMSSELGISLAKLRGNGEKEELTSKWNELSNFEVGFNNNPICGDTCNYYVLDRYPQVQACVRPKRLFGSAVNSQRTMQRES